jgi:hypothetical protein
MVDQDFRWDLRGVLAFAAQVAVSDSGEHVRSMCISVGSRVGSDLFVGRSVGRLVSRLVSQLVGWSVSRSQMFSLIQLEEKETEVVYIVYMVGILQCIVASQVYYTRTQLTMSLHKAL